jgi:hypothetical protein
MELGDNADRGLTHRITDGAAVRSSGAACLVGAKDTRPNLTALEWQVVAAAFSDASGYACGSRRKPSRITSLVRRSLEAFTGLRASPPLADPRLEKLRFFLCFTRNNGRPTQRIWEELLELGFNEAQLEALALLAVEGARPRG